LPAILTLGLVAALCAGAVAVIQTRRRRTA
jgi:hypothetical protein